MTHFSDSIRAIREGLRRENRRFSLRQVAQRIGVEPAYLSKIERGHVCFGYAAVVRNKPKRAYSILPELARTNADQLSIEAAQRRLDLTSLTALSRKTVVVAILDLKQPRYRRAVGAHAANSCGAGDHPSRSTHRRAGLQDEVPAERSRLRQAAFDGAGRRTGTG